MPHESTVDPEEPMHFKSWGDETSGSDSPGRLRSTSGQSSQKPPYLKHSQSIQTHPDLPLRVTHDHDDDGDPDEDDSSAFDQDPDSDAHPKVTYKPPAKKMDQGQE